MNTKRFLQVQSIWLFNFQLTWDCSTWTTRDNANNYNLNLTVIELLILHFYDTLNGILYDYSYTFSGLVLTLSISLKCHIWLSLYPIWQSKRGILYRFLLDFRQTSWETSICSNQNLDHHKRHLCLYSPGI